MEGRSLIPRKEARQAVQTDERRRKQCDSVMGCDGCRLLDEPSDEPAKLSFNNVHELRGALIRGSSGRYNASHC